MNRVKKMMKVAIFMLAANLLADKTAFDIVKEHILS